MTQNVVSMSGGKDSTATLLVAQAREVPNLSGVFADTGHEHPETYEYVRYLERATGVPIRWIRADFSQQIARKRLFIDTVWREQGVPDIIVDAALAVMVPTGNPFLDLCLWKGRFPSTKARFCTEELKTTPIIEQVMLPLMDQGEMILSWQGVRLDESHARRIRLQGTGACVKAVDEVGGGLFNYRPILRWTVQDVFEAHRYMGIKPNPLYLQGMTRVGCMPCVNCSKDELAQIAARFPEEIARVREWERLVALASKRGSATFFPTANDPMASPTDAISVETHGIDRMVEWARTSRGGRQYDLIARIPADDRCSSAYGLCE
ncbi:phosphoadenosine phosphosulfate reductase family protein [Alloalcanivorax xenomutans]|uniref:phosphoadenosine phosphosulfate reductase domain-containing protein n=1 Tax=Alloalcanivorax xenomutans TaxID=1094342 RepID=UPI003BA9B2C8